MLQSICVKMQVLYKSENVVQKVYDIYKNLKIITEISWFAFFG